jgi:hypothetical protein
MTFLMPSPILGAAPSFITTVQVMPALIKTHKPEPIEWDETTYTAAAVPEEAPVEEEPSTLAH